MNNELAKYDKNPVFEGWEYPEPCKKCKSICNNDKKEPIQYLDITTKLCEFCFHDEFCD